MSVLRRSLVAALAAVCVDAAVVVPQTVSTPLYITTTADSILPHQGAVAPVPGPSPSGSTVSTRLITTTLATTEIFTGNVTSTVPGLATPQPSNLTWTQWQTTRISTQWSETTKWEPCVVTATCTNATTDANGKLIIPIPFPVLIIWKDIVPVQGPRPIVELPEDKPQSVPTMSMKSLSSQSDSSSTGVSSSESSFTSSVTTSLSSSTSSSSYETRTTSFSSSTSSKTSVSSFSSTDNASSAGLSCPTGVALSSEADEGDNEDPNAGAFCARLSLELNDEEDFDLGDWHDFGNSSIVPIPTLQFKTSSSSSSMKHPAAPTLPHQTTLKTPSAPTLPTSANRPNGTPTPTSSIVPTQPGPSEVKCSDIRPYTGPNAREDCQNDEYCKTFEWWGPIGGDPFRKLPAISTSAENNTWDGFERTCEPYKESPNSYYCRSCTRNLNVCKIKRWYNKHNFSGGQKSPIEECWTDEICENDRDHSRICHARNPWKNLRDYQDTAFCMECPRNAPVDPDADGCFKQMDFTEDDRQDFPPYTDHSYHDCGRYCVSDDYAKRKCIGQQCYSCPK